MKTAVEWLIDNLTESKFLWLSDKPEMDDLIKIITQAKEMEKQQKGYSEEDMNEYAMYILKHNVITPKKWFEHFKNK
jgi:hypothetical protein